jgi:hypothetical protein
VRATSFGAARTSYPIFNHHYTCLLNSSQHSAMALRLGVGDVFTVCKGAVDLCSRGIHDEPEDVKSVIAEMKLIRAHLKELESQIGDEKAFVTARPDM